MNKFTTTRKTDPLNPAYQLPVVIYAPFPEVKFIRDNLFVDVFMPICRILREPGPNKPLQSNWKELERYDKKIKPLWNRNTSMCPEKTTSYLMSPILILSRNQIEGRDVLILWNRCINYRLLSSQILKKLGQLTVIDQLCQNKGKIIKI